MAIVFYGCADKPRGSHGAIVLGNPATIVTETDTQNLRDMVIDLQPALLPDTVAAKSDSPKKDSPAVAATGAATNAGATAPLPADATGLKADFKEVSVLISGIAVKQAGKTNLTNAGGAVYTLQSGNIQGSILRISCATLLKVSQRYQTVILLKTANQTFYLDDLDGTTDWAPITGSNGAFTITGLAPNQLKYETANAAEIRDALAQMCRKKHYNAKRKSELMNAIAGVRAVNQAPLHVFVRSVMWKIDGKDNTGKIFSKQIRIDIPF